MKLRGRDERAIADFHAMTQAEYLQAAWADPAKGALDYAALPDSNWRHRQREWPRGGGSGSFRLAHRQAQARHVELAVPGVAPHRSPAMPLSGESVQGRCFSTRR
jgi:hypothetical protein